MKNSVEQMELSSLNKVSLVQGWREPGSAPGQASDYTLRAPNPLDSRTHDQMFYQDFGPS